MLRFFLVISLGLVISGCAKDRLTVGSITPIKSHTGSEGIDVHAAARVAGQSALPEFAGDQLVEVRTFSSDPDKGSVEMAGATCNLDAAHFSADMQTPAKVRVPLYRGKSSALSIICEKPGFKKASKTIEAFDATRNQRFARAGAGGLAGVAVVALIDAASDNSKNDWRYPVAEVFLEPVPNRK